MHTSAGARRARLVAVLLALVATSAGCGGEDDPGGDGPEAALSALPGVRAAAVTDELVDQDRRGTVAVVDTEAGIDADRLGDVVEALEDLDPAVWVVRIDCGETTWPWDDEPGDCDSATGGLGTEDGGRARDVASRLVAASASFPGAQVRVERDAATRVDLPAGDGWTIQRALATVTGDPTLSQVDDLTLRAPREEDLHDVLTSNGPLPPTAPTTWAGLSATQQRLPAGAAGALRLTIGESGALHVSTTVVLPGVVPPELLTTARQGRTLWPYLRAQLGVVATLPRGTTYDVANAYRTEAGGRAFGNDPFLSVRTGAPGQADERGRTWSVEAARYLTAVGSG